MLNKFLRKISANQFFIISLIVLIIFLSLGLGLNWQNNKMSESARRQMVQQESLTIARAGALSISEFLFIREKELLVVAKDPVIASLNDKNEARKTLEAIISKLTGTPVSTIVRVDKNGRTSLIINPEKNTQGEDSNLVTDREYFIWAKNPQNHGFIFISQPYIARGGVNLGKLVFSMAAPVYYQDKFNGVLLMSMRISDFSKHYIEPLAPFEKSNIYFVNDQGTLLSGGSVDLLGKNLIDYAKKEKWPGFESYVSMLNDSVKKEGVGQWIVKYPQDQKPQEKIGAYIPLDLQGKKLAIIISNPYDVTGQFFPEFNVLHIIGLLLIVSSILISGIFWTTSIRLAQRDGFLDGVRDGYRRAKDQG